MGLLPLEVMACGVTALRGHGVWGYCLKRTWCVGLLPYEVMVCGVTALRGHGVWEKDH